jgi:cell pole-organizing protein PopZ
MAKATRKASNKGASIGDILKANLIPEHTKRLDCSKATIDSVTIGGKKLNVKENKNSMKNAEKQAKIDAQQEQDELFGIDREGDAVDASIVASLNVQAKLMQDILARLESLESGNTSKAEPVVEPKAEPKAEPVKVSAKAKAKAKKASKKAKADPKAESPIGELVICKTKAEAKRLREARGGGNSTKYTCEGAEGLPCKGFGYHDAFAEKHVAKGHKVTQIG